MTTLTAIGILAAVLIPAVVAHEAAHALALRQLGYPIREAGIGLPFPPRLVIPPRGRRTFALSLSPWLVGAYVSTHEEDHDNIDQLPYRDAAWYLNAGVIANLAIGLGLWTAAAAGRSNWPLAAGLAAATAAVALNRKFIAAYVLPALALPVLAVVGWAFATAWSNGSTGVGYAGLIDMIPTDAVGLIGFAGAANLALALFNVAPIFPLDGGRVADLIIRRVVGQRAVSWFRAVGTAFMLTLLVGAVASDVWAVIS
jgi:membrane-associated protease RseP (regulator of RpoE activity)